MDGDAKINLKEFQIGMKSSLTVFGGKKGAKRPRSSGSYHIKIVNPIGGKRGSVTPRKAFASPKFTHAADVIPPRKGRVKSAGRSTAI